MLVTAPAPPGDIGDEAAHIWTEFWTSPIAQTVTLSAPRGALDHRIGCVSQRYRLWDTGKNQPLSGESTLPKHQIVYH